MPTAPDINNSTLEERYDFVESQWKCLNHCSSCGRCHILKGRDEFELYADYIKGERQYVDISKEIRQ